MVNYKTNQNIVVKNKNSNIRQNIKSKANWYLTVILLKKNM